jgi:hypothetical protein
VDRTVAESCVIGGFIDFRINTVPVTRNRIVSVLLFTPVSPVVYTIYEYTFLYWRSYDREQGQ